MSFRFVICATDTSPAATVALREAHRLASSRRARFGVLLVMPTPLGPHPLDPQRYAETYAEVPATQAEALDALRSHALQTLGTQTPAPDFWVEHGVPHTVIVRHAEALGADLLVLGAHGHSAFKALLLGSVTDPVLRHAHCSVLIAREDPREGAVVAATDFSTASQRAVSLAAEEARYRSARLVVLHSIGPLVNLMVPAAVAPGLAPPAGAVTAEERRGLRRQAQGRMDEVRNRVNVDCDLAITEGDPAGDVVHAAGERGASLIVVGSVGRTGLARILLGSVAEDVTRESPCSVLVAR